MQRTIATAPAAPPAVTTPTPTESGASNVEQLLHRAPAPAHKVLRSLVAAQARHMLFLPEQTILIAVSGGADSVCLLHALHQLAPDWRLSLCIAHLDHALRPDSADDAAFVASLAQQFALPFYQERLEPGILDDVAGGLEVAARSARYAFLRQVANQLAAVHVGNASMDAATPTLHPVAIATAHHQDDQSETLLLHLVQGSGLAGLAGMAWVGHIPDAHQPPIRLVRPLLGVSRADIHNYLHSYALSWREDSSNRDLAHPRNQLRHAVLPLLATINPNIHATLARTADLLAAEAEHANVRDRAALSTIMVSHTPSTRIVLDLFHLAQVDLATQRGVLRQALLVLGIDLRTAGMDKIETLLDPTRTTKASGPHPLVADWRWTILSHGTTRQLSLHRADALPIPLDHPHFDAPLPTPLAIPRQGALPHERWRLHSTLLAPNALPADWRSRALPWRLFGDAEQCGDLYLTTFQAGMSIAPLGMGGHQRALGDIFTDHKIPPYLRAGWPVVLDGNGVVIWLCGLVVAETVRVQPSTHHVRHLFWQSLETDPAS